MSVQIVVLRNDFPRIAGNLPRATSGVMQRMLSVAVGIAQALVPVDTGLLQSSINMEVVSDLVVRLVALTYYAAYVELGTYKMAARPYLLPAALQVLGQLQAYIGSFEADLL